MTLKLGSSFLSPSSGDRPLDSLPRISFVDVLIDAPVHLCFCSAWQFFTSSDHALQSHQGEPLRPRRRPFQRDLPPEIAVRVQYELAVCSKDLMS
jgi:hypothetical protein